MKTKLQNELLAVDRALDEEPWEAQLYLERGRLHNKLGELDKALNDFIKVRELDPENEEAKEQINMISDIFEYRYNDIYNP